MTNSKIDAVTSELTESFVKDLQLQISKQVTADVAQKLAQIDIQQAVRDYVDRALANSIKHLSFTDGSIPGSAIDLSTLILSGNNIHGGIVAQFGSTGIQDNATSCQVTILDDVTVIENKLLVKEVEVKGNLVVDGDLILTGEIPTDSQFFKDLVERGAGLLKLSMDGQFFLQYADKVFERIATDGIDLTKLSLNGNKIFEGNQLGYFVTDTNIQKLGELRSLTVNGDASMSNTLFSRNKRVGINTEEPSGALAIWDEECELVARKLRKDVSIFGSMREQRVILSANNKNNIVLETDGTVSVEKITVGAVQLSSAPEIPTHDAPKGSIVFNENPDHSKAMGWQSLGGARWATFGIIG